MLPKSACPPLGTEIVKLHLLPEIQRPSFDLQGEKTQTFLSQIENLLFSKEVYEGTLTSGGHGIRILNKGKRADRKNKPLGRAAYDMRLVNLISVLVYGLRTRADDVHFYLQQEGIAGYQAHDIAGAFRTIRILRRLQSLLGVQLGSRVGRAITGLLGMRSLGNTWNNWAYPLLSSCEFSKTGCDAFWKEILSAYDAEIRFVESEEKLGEGGLGNPWISKVR